MATEIKPEAITKEQAEKHGPTASTCVFCGSDRVEWEADKSTDGQTWQDASCGACGRSFREIHAVTWVVAIDEETGEEIGTPMLVRPDLSAIAEELADAYMEFYGGDFNEPNETTPEERDMIKRARKAIKAARP